MDADVLAENGQVDPSLFPHFAALARTSAFLTNATSNYFDTSVSIQSLVTGVYYGDDGFFQAQDSSIQDVGVLKILKDAGYSVVLHSNFSQLVKCGDERFFLCRAEATAVVNKGIHKVARDFAIDFVPRKISLSARDLILKIFPGSVTIIIPFPSIHQYDRPLWNQFLAGVGRSESPGKVYLVHLTLPHHPYELDRMGRRTRTIGPDGGFEDLKQMANNYREQVTFVDTLLGELIEKLKAEELYNQSLLVVTADHGHRSLGLGQKYAGFREHSFFPDDLANIIPRVPLIIHGPGIEPQVSEVDYQHIDYLPTILDSLGLPVPSGLPGVSGFSPTPPIREKLFIGFPSPSASTDQASYIYDGSSQRWSKVKSVKALGDTGQPINGTSGRTK